MTINQRNSTSEAKYNRITRWIRIFLAIEILAGGTLACSLSDYLPKNTPAPGQVLYQDDFSNTNSGWDTWSDNDATVSYLDGGLRFKINKAQYDFWSRPGKRFDNASLQVDATKMTGPDNNDFGLICRYKDEDHFYAFLISSDGYAGIVKMKDGQYQLITTDHMQYSEIIRRGNATNHLRAECLNQTLYFYVNDQALLSTQDSDYDSGEIGLVTGSYEEPGVDILFDNFLVYKP